MSNDKNPKLTTPDSSIANFDRSDACKLRGLTMDVCTDDMASDDEDDGGVGDGVPAGDGMSPPVAECPSENNPGVAVVKVRDVNNDGVEVGMEAKELLEVELDVSVDLNDGGDAEDSDDDGLAEDESEEVVVYRPFMAWLRFDLLPDPASC